MVLDIFGEGPLVKELGDLVSLYELSCRVRLKGFIARESLYREVRMSDGLVVCSYTEGFCNAAVEAMALGAPVIYTPVDALREVIGPAGFCISGFSSLDIARGIYDFLQVSRIEMIKKKEQAKARAYERFSMGAAAHSFSRLYSRVDVI